MSDSAGPTELLQAWAAGDRAAQERLLPMVYEELRRVAERALSRERKRVAPQATELIHEAYLRLVDQPQPPWRDRTQFFGFAARVMRQVLVDQARSRQAAKRGGGAEHTCIREDRLGLERSEIDVLALDRALRDLSQLHERPARVVELRFFAGLSIEQTAEVLGIAKITVRRDWTTAKAYLHQALAAD